MNTDLYTHQEQNFKNKNIKAKTHFGELYFKQTDLASKLKLSHHITDNIVMLKNGDLFTVFEVKGISFYTEDSEDLISFTRRFHNWMRNVGDDSLTIYSHIIRSKVSLDYKNKSESKFSQMLDDAYIQKIKNSKLFKNSLYIGLQVKPKTSKFNLLSLLSKKVDKSNVFNVINEAKEKLEDILIATKGYLGATEKKEEEKEEKGFDFRIRHLGIYEEKGIKYSEIGEFESLLLNNKKVRIPVKASSLSSALATTDITFAKNSFEVDPINRNLFVGAVLGFREYPHQANSRVFDKLLSLPIEFCVSQSFRFINRHKAMGLVQTRLRKMDQAEDVGYEEYAQLEDGLQHIQNGQIFLGYHNINLFIYARNTDELKKNVAEASSIVSECGAVINRESFANEAAFFARFAGNNDLQPRPTLIPSDVFSQFSSLHTYPVGQVENNHWGDALSLFKSSGNSPYFFSWHLADIGNSIIIGPSGSGKTVLQGFLISQSEKQNIRTIFIDKDRGGEIMVKALGGAYQTLRMGKPSGFAPLRAFNNTAEDIQWLVLFLENQHLQAHALCPNICPKDD